MLRRLYFHICNVTQISYVSDAQRSQLKSAASELCQVASILPSRTESINMPTRFRGMLPKAFVRRAVLRNGSVRYSSSAPSVLLQRDIPAPHCGSIRILTLNNERTRNAISTRLLSELGRHVNEIHGQGSQGQTRALILASDVNSSFCAGADLKERAGFTTKQ